MPSTYYSHVAHITTQYIPSCIRQRSNLCNNLRQTQTNKQSTYCVAPTSRVPPRRVSGSLVRRVTHPNKTLVALPVSRARGERTCRDAESNQSIRLVNQRRRVARLSTCAGGYVSRRPAQSPRLDERPARRFTSIRLTITSQNQRASGLFKAPDLIKRKFHKS